MVLRNILPLIVASASAVQCLAETKTKQQTRPNIILFIVDDMGWQDTSLPFWTERTPQNDRFETPNMERLARQGMMFTQAYASAISSPSRCSLITGANVCRHRVTNWTLERDKSTDIENDIVTPPDWNYNGISQVSGTNNTFVATSFVDILRRNGYHTIHCGKAHFGAIDTPGESPTHFGFEQNIAGHAAGGLASYLSENNFGHTKDGKPYALNAIPGLEKYWGTGTFATEALTKEAIKALDKAKKYRQPFFLYMAHYAVHIPIDKDMRFYQKHIDRGMTAKEAAYAALIEGMDKSLGDIMDWLSDNDEADNTILIFMSDNGGLASSAEWRDGTLHSQNLPLNSGKGSLYEGGVRVPMIVSWNGTTRKGSRCDKYVIIEDLYPTILEMAGVKHYRTTAPIDGKSMVPLLTETGDTSKGRALFWNCPNVWGNAGPGISLDCAVRKGDWKLVYHYDTGKKELFNIATDIGEKTNVAAQNPTVLKRMSKELGRYLRSVDAQRPSFKSTGKPCPWPDEI